MSPWSQQPCNKPIRPAFFPDHVDWQGDGTSRISFAVYTSEALHRRELDRFLDIVPEAWWPERGDDDAVSQRHVIGAPRLLQVHPNQLVCELNHAVFRTKLSELTTVLNVGRYLNTVVRTDAGWRFASKLCIYDSEMISNSIICPI